MPLAVYLLGRYDVWDHAADERVLPFQYGMRQFRDTLPDNQELWGRVLTDDAFCEEIANDGELLLAYEQNQNEKFCRAYSFETSLNDLPAICANRGFTNSKLFDSVYDPAKHAIMISFIRANPPGNGWNVSLYSTRDDVDCGAIAKKYMSGMKISQAEKGTNITSSMLGPL